MWMNPLLHHYDEDDYSPVLFFIGYGELKPSDARKQVAEASDERKKTDVAIKSVLFKVIALKSLSFNVCS